jgi:hypothetical protein
LIACCECTGTSGVVAAEADADVAARPVRRAATAISLRTTGCTVGGVGKRRVAEA